MLDISLAGLLGAIAGTAVAAVTYHVFIGPLERRLRARLAKGAGLDRSDLSMSMIRRAVLITDLSLCAGLGYWLGRSIAG